MSDTTTHDVMVAQTEKMQEGIDYFQGHRGMLEADRLAHGQAVSTMLSNASAAIGAPSIIAFDPAVLHSKASLFADTMVVDAAQPWRTEWCDLSTNSLPSLAYIYSAVNGRAFLRTSRNWSTNTGGSTNNPPYSTDYSQTKTQFVLASAYATTEQIDQWIINNPDALDGQVGSHGGNTAFSGEIPIISVPGSHPYKSLRVRFINEINPLAINAGTANDQSPLQNVQTFGGNSFFGLHSVQHHPF